MSNEEIASRLAAGILVPSVSLPARFANIDVKDAQIQHAAELAVAAYQAVLALLERPESP